MTSMETAIQESDAGPETASVPGSTGFESRTGQGSRRAAGQGTSDLKGADRVADLETRMKELLVLTSSYRELEKEIGRLRSEVLDGMLETRRDWFDDDLGRIEMKTRTRYDWDMPALKNFLGEELFEGVISVKVKDKLAAGAIKSRTLGTEEYENALAGIGNPRKGQYLLVKTPRVYDDA